jgi:hypothetical protein
VLDVRGEEPTTPTLMPYPRHRKRRLPIPELRIGVLEALALADCDLLPLIAERNAISGKVMAASQRLIYETRLLDRLRRCPARLEAAGNSDPPLVMLVDEAIAMKEQYLRRAFWAATFDGPEMAQAFSLSNKAIRPGESVPFLVSMEALAALVGIGAGLGGQDGPPDSAYFESQLQSLTVNEFGGRIAHAERLLSRKLHRVADALEKAVARRPICIDGKPNRKAETLKTVFHKFYAGHVQPYLAQVHQQGRDWRRQLHALLAAQPADRPAAFDAYWTTMWSDATPRALGPSFRAAAARHTKAWQNVLGQCQLMPGQSASD